MVNITVLLPFAFRVTYVVVVTDHVLGGLHGRIVPLE